MTARGGVVYHHVRLKKPRENAKTTTTAPTPRVRTMKKISIAILWLVVGFCLIAGALANPAPELPTLGKHYNIYTDRMRHDIVPPEFNFDDSTSPDRSSKTDKGQGGYYEYSLYDNDYNYDYATTVCFQSDKRISLISYFCMKGFRGRHFSPDEVDYLLAVSSGTSFKEVPTGQEHCVAGLWKSYVSPDGRTQATVGYTLESGKLEAFCVQVRSRDLKICGHVASCGGWIY